MNGVALERAADTVDLEMQQRTRYVLFAQVLPTHFQRSSDTHCCFPAHLASPSAFLRPERPGIESKARATNRNKAMQ